jgi:hypothetical protein
MKSSALQAIFWVFVIFCSTVQTQPQTKPAKKEAPSSISGKVTIKGKGAPGIVVGMRAGDLGGYGSQWTAPYKATTDEEGNYRITNVASGSYRILPAAPAFVNSGDPGGKTLIITAGETVEDMDFTLTLGGVITGKALDSEGLPLIEEQVTLLPAEANNQIGRYMSWSGRMQTDDRGTYRIFGIPPGRYKVAVGQSEDGSFVGGPRRSRYKQTFSPGVMDSSKAAVIEVTEGSEATNVDITAARSLTTFAVSGRIINGETLQPLPNIRLGLQKIVTNGTEFMNWGSTSNSQGEFKLENVTPGKYELLLAPQANGGMRADTVRFEVIDSDVSGLQVKLAAGASLSGQVVLDGRNDRSGPGMLSQVWIHTHVSTPANDRASSWVQPVTLGPDGSFRVRGLQSGFVNFSLTAADARPVMGLALVRIERDGMAQPAGIEIKDGEQVTGVRLVASYGNGTIRGLVKIENGELPPNARFFVRFTSPGDDPTRVPTLPPPEVDSRGHFFVEGLAAGIYQVQASMFIPGSRIRPSSVTQQVNVADGTVTEVTLTLKLEPTPGPGNP